MEDIKLSPRQILGIYTKDGRYTTAMENMHGIIKAKSVVLIAAMPEPNNIPSSAYSSAHTFSTTAC